MTKSNEKEQMRQAFLQALVKEYGEGSVVTRQQLISVWTKNRSKYPHFACVRKNPEYKVARNQFVVTTSNEPSKVRDQVAKQMQQNTTKMSNTKIKTTKNNVAKMKKEAPATFEDTETLGNDDPSAAAILRTMNN